MSDNGENCELFYKCSKNTHNSKDMELCFFKILKFQKSFTTCNGV
jgi:hypothetical protein